MSSGEQQQLPRDPSGIYNNQGIEKQMAALSAANMAKIANRSAPGHAPAHSPNLNQSGSSSYFGGNSQIQQDRSESVSRDFSNVFPQSAPSMAASNPPSFPDTPSMSMNRPNLSAGNPQLQMHQKRRQFLHGLGTLMAQRNTPLPPGLTGVPYPQNYDPNNSPWKMLEVSPVEPGYIRIAGKDVDLYRLWCIVYQHGGGMKVRIISADLGALRYSGQI
jgi:SWI/SNF chromatin-remodeling complex subunit SWI1